MALGREQALKQIERRRRFKVSSAIAAIGMSLLGVIWAFTEYHNAGGWPTHGFSQNSGIPNVRPGSWSLVPGGREGVALVDGTYLARVSYETSSGPNGAYGGSTPADSGRRRLGYWGPS